MPDRSVTLRLSANVTGLVNGLKTGKRAMQDLSQGAKAFGPTASQASLKAQAAFLKAGQAAHQAAAKTGMMYDSAGKLTDQFGRLVSETAATKAGLKAVSEEARFAAEHADKAAEAWQGLGKASLTVGAGLMAGVGLAVKSYADFDKQMSSVDAATHETAGNMDLLRQAAIDAGADTAFSASEAAQGIEEMAKAGVATSDILGGGLKGTLALAAAGALGVGEASEIASSAMTQFGLRGKDIPHIADLLAAAAGKAQGSVQDMGLALSYAGVPAAGLGISIEQTTGTLALFAKSGITGEKAGTALRAMLVSMVKPSGETQKAMDGLGISFSNNEGKFIGLDGAAAVLQERLGGVDDMTRNAALAQIFGNEALGAAQTLYKGGAKGVQDMTAAVDEYGYAADTAKRMQNNLAGDLEKLGGSFDSLLIKSGGANDVMRGVAQGLEGIVDTAGKVPGPVLAVELGLAAAAGGAALLGGGLITIIPKIAETRAALGYLPIPATEARGALAGVGKTAGYATVALVGLQVASQLAGTGLDDIGTSTQFEGGIRTLKSDADSGAASIDKLATVSGSSLTEINGLGDALKKVNMNDFLKALDWVGSMGFDTEFGLAQEAVSRYDAALSAMAKSGNFDLAAAGFKRAADAGKEQQVSLEEVGKSFPGYLDALRKSVPGVSEATSQQDLLNWALTGTPPAAVAAGDAAKAAAGGTSALGDAAAEAAPSLEDVVSALFALGMIHMDSRSAAAEFDKSLRDAQKTAQDLAAEEKELAAKGETLGSVLLKNGKDFDTTTEAGYRANEAFQDVSRKGMAEFETKAKEGAGSKELQSSLKDTYEGLKTTANGFGITGTAADNLARDVLGVPDGVSVDSWMSDAAKRVAQDTKAAVDALNGKRVDIYAYTHDITLKKTIEDPTGMGSSIGGRQNGSLRGGAATGGRVGDVAGLAAGGRVPGTPPADKSKDNMLGVVKGRLIGLQSDEWVINGASSNKYDRELAAINAGTFPKYPGFATGGRVGWSDRQDDQAAKLAAAATAKREALASARWHAQQAYDKIGSSKKNAARKAAAQRALKAAEKREKSAEAAEDRAKEKLRDAKERTARLSESTRDLRTDIRRGDIVGSVMSGSGLSVVDRLRDESRNKDLTVKQRGNLASVAGSSEKQLLSLEKRSDSLASKLEKAKSKFDDLLSIQSGVASKLSGEQSLSGFMGLLDDKAAAKADANFKKVSASAQSNLDKVSAKLDAAKGKLDAMVTARDSVASGLSGEQSLGSALGQKNSFGYDKPVTSKSLIAGAKAKYTAIRAFAGKLEKLRSMGLSTVILEEVAGLGSEDGAQVADALIKGGKADVQSLNSAYSGIEYRSRLAGDAIAKSMGKHGVAGGKKLVEGLESQQAAATKALNALTTPDAKGTVTAKGMVANAKATADRIGKFADKLGKLQKRGLSGAILEEIAGMGTEEGMRAADALLAGSDWSIKELNTQYRRIETYSQKAGLQVTEGFYKGGVNAAKGLVAGLEDQQDAIEAQMLKIAKGMQTALKKALDINSPSRVLRKLMHHVGDGAVLGLEDSRPAVESAMTAMVTAPQATFGSWSGMVQPGSGTSAPVMELSAADRALMSQFITASQTMPPMNLLLNGRQAGAIVQEGNKAVRTLK